METRDVGGKDDAGEAARPISKTEGCLRRQISTKSLRKGGKLISENTIVQKNNKLELHKEMRNLKTIRRASGPTHVAHGGFGAADPPLAAPS